MSWVNAGWVGGEKEPVLIFLGFSRDERRVRFWLSCCRRSPEGMQHQNQNSLFLSFCKYHVSTFVLYRFCLHVFSLFVAYAPKIFLANDRLSGAAFPRCCVLRSSASLLSSFFPPPLSIWVGRFNLVNRH